MTTRKKLLLQVVLALVVGLFGAWLVYAQQRPPVRNISPHRHPNLAAAQRITDRAYQKILEAQQANEFDLGGHAQHAKELLEQANRELKAAAQVSNENREGRR